MKTVWKTNAVIKNAGWLMAGRVIQLLINLVVGLLTARYLGPSNYGLIGYGTAYTGFFYSLCTLGINSVMVKELLDAPDKEGETLGTSLLLRFVSSALSVLLILCIVYVADDGDRTTLLVVGLTAVGMLFQTFELFFYWFQSRLQSKVTALVSLIAYIITAAYRVILLVSGKSVVWFAFATAVDYMAVAVLIFRQYRKHGGRPLGISLTRGREILRKSCHFILPGLMVAVYGQTDKIMLKQMIGDAEIGFYSTAVSLCSVWCFVLSAIIDSLYPEITKAHKADKALFERRNRQLYALVFYISMTVSVMIACFARPIVWIMYGEAYLPTVAPLRVITWYTAFSYLGVARNAWVVCENRQKYLIWIYASAAISNVVLNILLIPRWGAVGAAAASLAAQVITTMVTPFFIPGMRRNAMLMLEAIMLKDIFRK